MPPATTERLYLADASLLAFDARVVAARTHAGRPAVVLDRTAFYPEGGGQPADTGTLIGAESMAQVDGVVKVGEVILHHISGGILHRGERIKGMVDEERRWSLMRHHTATHVLLHAAKEILGAHIHQAGAQKGSESSRVDIRHFKHITPDELRRIEVAANRMIMASQPVEIEIEDRTKAEMKYGFSLYQGGVPPGREIRIVKVAGDIEACAGTHCRSTGEVGVVKIIRVEHIQDGIERIEFAAGIAAIYYMQHLEGIVSSSAVVLSVQDENLPPTVTRFFTEWKEQRKDIERMTAKLVELEMRELLTFYEFPGEEIPIVRVSALKAMQNDAEAENQIVALMDAVDNYVPIPVREMEKPFLMPVEDIFTISGRGTVATGRVERGKVRVGEEIEIVGMRDTVKRVVTGVEMFRKLLDEGMAGDNVGLLLRGTDKSEVERGQVIAAPGSITPHTHFKGQAYILSKEEGGRHTPFFNGYRPQFYFRTTDVTGVAELPEGTEMVMPGDNVSLTVDLITPVAMDKGLRFAIREGGRTVGAGTVTEVIE